MNLTYYNIDKSVSSLVEEFYSISYSDTITPFKTTIIPMGFSSLAFIYAGNQSILLKNNQQNFQNLTLFGQFYQSYTMFVESLGYSCGISFKPTSLYKITSLDISTFTNKHINILNLNLNFSKELEAIFLKHRESPKILFSQITLFLAKLPIIENKDTLIIDKVIDEIHKKEGLLSVLDILQTIPFGQKTLETKFKKMVGLTPGKYIRLKRFLSLMRKYEKEQIDLKDLIYMYDYYDESHFSKDFKLFSAQSFKKFFKEDYLIIKAALKK